MSNNHTWSSLGEQIRDSVEDALHTGDFSQLNNVISDTVTSAIDTARDQIANTISGKNSGQPRRNMTEEWVKQKKETEDAASRERAAQWKKSEAVKAIRAPFKKIGRISGTLYQVFGGVGTGVMAILSLVFLGLTLGFGGGFKVAFGVFALLLIVFIVMINVGCRQKRRLRRAEKYRELSGHNNYVNLEELSLHIGRPMKYIVKDIKKMLEDGFFPEGHLDRQETCLMLDDKIYNEYLALEKQRKMLEREQQAKETAHRQKKQDPMEQKTANSQLEDIIAEGQEYIRRLRDLNDNIPGEVISAKLFRLENLLKEIFDSLKEHPEQIPNTQKFMGYYLPTTIKLVAAYEEFDSLSVQGEDIREAKEEIEKTLDTINRAFGELLNKLFRETAYDVTTDAQVLQTMLAQEGLTGSMKEEKVFAEALNKK